MVVATKGGKGGKARAAAAASAAAAAAAAPGGAAPPRPALTIGQQTSHITNKQARGAVYAKLKHKKAKEKGAARRARQAADAEALRAGLTPAPVRPQRTIESAREADPTTPAPGDEDAAAAAAHDEFSAYFAGARPPRLMLTTTASPKARTFALIADLLEVLPAATYYRRGGAALARVAAAAAKKEFTHLLVLNEGPAGVDSLLVAHLPGGPTARFRMTSIRLARSIPGHGRAVAGTAPELVLAGFTTRLGARVGRLLASMFPPVPAFKARQVATFHAQRDFIFFRHHRYIFEQKAKAGKAAAAAAAAGAADPPHAQGVSARLQELGPRFTLRLSALYKGVLAGPGAETEWVATRAAKGAGANRRRFVL